MIYKFQYLNEQEREQIISDNADKFLIEVHNLVDGNFLVFTDEAPSTESLENKIQRLEEDNLILMDALATTYEEVLLIKAQTGGTSA